MTQLVVEKGRNGVAEPDRVRALARVRCWAEASDTWEDLRKDLRALSHFASQVETSVRNECTFDVEKCLEDNNND
jgi:hypothetical protein